MLLIRRAPRGSAAWVLAFELALLPALVLFPGPGDLRAQDGTGRDDPLPDPPDAESSEGGHGFVEFRLGYYDNDDSGDGNPFLDESLTVIEPVVIFDYDLNEKLGLWGKFSYDNVSSASIDRLSNFPEQSGASGDNYFGLDVGVRYRLGPELRTGGFISASTEYDYQSIGLGGYIERDLAGKNATLKWSLNGFYDSVDVIRFDGTEEGDDDRTTLTTSLTWYQIIGPRTHGELGTTLTLQDGFLETPYNAVVIEDPALPPNPNLDNQARGTEITEELPDDRVRGALFGRVRHSLTPRLSAELGGRIYSDSWGIHSFAVEPRLYYWLWPERCYARLRYRYYTQTAADAYEDSFVAIEDERTQDSDLADFDSQTVGLKLVWFFSETLRMDVGGDVVQRSDGLDQLIGSIGLHYDF